MDSKTIRDRYIKFFIDKNHKQIPPSKLVPENDPSTLFTSSGMQPLVPYLLGQVHPEGKRLVNSQPCFRAEDIEEVGDNRHTTFFEMLGNWSLGDYFKKEQLAWCWEFLTKEIGLDKDKLHVAVFEGNDAVPKDNESYEIWKSLGLNEEQIHFYGVEKNWWSRSGPPDKMPEGEIGGPDSEVFYEFTNVEHDKKFGDKCHPNCDCGRFLEICNSVFIEFQKQKDGSLKELSQKNVDFGGGLERITAAVNDNPDIFRIDLNENLIGIIEKHAGREYSQEHNKQYIRIIIDHLKAATFLIIDNIIPSNKLHGYVLRRLLRRSALKTYQLTRNYTFLPLLVEVCKEVLRLYDGLFSIKNTNSSQDLVRKVVWDEVDKFLKNLEKGLKEIDKLKEINGKVAFDLYQTFGFPYEMTEELFRQKGNQQIDREQFKKEFEKHRELSRTASSGMFKGGLAGHSATEIKYHTATHLLHQALRDVLGPTVFQQGSNITTERLRFDFSFDRKMTDEEVKKVEALINKRIEEDLTVDHMIISLDEAKEMNAIGLFDGKYSGKVSIYGIGSGYKLDKDAKDKRVRGGYYSLEFCGGPHVEHTGEIGKIKITKEEAISAGIRRIRAEIVLR
ncbi:MAG: alanine--tRNA ligase [Patescibacteria group bacterium]